MKNKLKFLFVALASCLIYLSCSQQDDLFDQQTLDTGSGFIRYQTQDDKELKVYYHIPANATANTKMLFVFHGGSRNARDYRNALVTPSDRNNFIVIAPEFSSFNFPGGDGYNLGNVFIDGDNPTPESLNPESEWAFSVVEPLFDHIKEQLNNTNLTYDIYGHSAGGQFAHRLLMFQPDLRVDRILASAAGWYTFPDQQISFPYGFADSPLVNRSFSDLLSRKLILQVGENDNDPNASSLRHNARADAQGTHRKERAEHFFEYAENLSITENTSFQWELVIQPNAGHDYVLASQNAADLLYE